MSYEHKPGSGTVFKETDASKPWSYTGKGKLPDGTDVFLNLYPVKDRTTGELRRDKDGNPFYNVGIKPMQRQGGGGDSGQPLERAERAKESFRNDDLDDSIPFD